MENVSIDTLEETPERVLPFLRAIATKVEIRAALMAAGYTEAEQAAGWKLLMDVVGQVPSTLPPTDDQKARNAIAELDAWDEPGFRRIRAALERLHPEQAEFVFSGLEPAQGAGSVVAVTALLERLAALESSAGRTASRKSDRAALETLAARGFDAAERQRLGALVALAQTARRPEVGGAVLTDDERLQALRDLRAWYRDWAETARALIHRRDHLILLGLAARRRGEVTDEPPTPTPIPVSPGSDAGVAI